MVRKDIHKNLMKQVAKGYPDITGAELEKVSKVVEKEALRKKGKKSKPKTTGKKKKDCGCDA